MGDPGILENDQYQQQVIANLFSVSATLSACERVCLCQVYSSSPKQTYKSLKLLFILASKDANFIIGVCALGTCPVVCIQIILELVDSAFGDGVDKQFISIFTNLKFHRAFDFGF